MTTKPLVSVVMPAYRCHETLCAAVDSALNQDVPLELLVVDDCPDAPIESVLEKYRTDPRVIYLKNDKNMGAAKSRNRAVALANAPYVAFLDSDDIWVSGKLQKQLALLEATGDVLCCTARELMTPQGQLTGKILPVKEHITYRDLLKFNCINCSSVLIKTEVARQFPMNHEDSHEDYIMWLRVLKEYGSARGINEPLLQYRLSTTGKSGNKLRSAQMTWRVYRHMGFGPVQSLVCFCSYAICSAFRYLFPKKRVM